MKDLLYKFILFLACCYLLHQTAPDKILLTAGLLAICVSSLCSYFEAARPSFILIVFYGAVSLIFPAYGTFLPLLLYDATAFSVRYGSILTVVCSFSLLRQFDLLYVFLHVVFMLAALLIASQSARLTQMQKKLYELEDSHTESTRFLKERNRDLIQKQDAELHLATLSERNRIAREIHDNVGHMLTRSILQTGAVQVLNQNPVLTEPLMQLSETLNQAMTSIRTSVHDLHDEAVDLQHTLCELIRGVEQPAIHLEYDMGNHIPRNIKYAFIAITREAVNNMHKHSNATSAYICVREHPGFYHLQIQDNGTVSSPIQETGIGLSNIRERVQTLNGTLRINTEHGFGIYITIMKG